MKTKTHVTFTLKQMVQLSSVLMKYIEKYEYMEPTVSLDDLMEIRELVRHEVEFIGTVKGLGDDDSIKTDQELLDLLQVDEDLLKDCPF